MLLGFATGVSGLLYVAVGWLQEGIGVGPAMGTAFLALVPAAFLAYGVLRHGRPFQPEGQDSILEAACRCLCASCGCYAESSGDALMMENRNSRCASAT